MFDVDTMEQAGQWAEIRQLGTAICEGKAGDDLARALLVLAKAFELTATGPADYRQSLAHVRAGVAAAQPDSLTKVWALGQCASMAADLGLFAEAEQTAVAFLRQLPDHPQAQAIEPYARLGLGKALSRRRRHHEAITHLRIAATVASGEIQERIQLTLTRVLARADRVSAALAACPASVQYVHEGKLHAACAVILDRAHDWEGARLHARAALQYLASQGACDLIETAELFLCLRRAAENLGHHRQAAVWLTRLAAILPPSVASIMISLEPESGPEGGGWIDAAVSNRGLPSGYKRVGLLGCVG